VDEILQLHAQAACGFGPLGHKQCCPNKFARMVLTPFGDDQKMEVEVIDISDSEGEVYHVCSQARCKANPYCLNFLGQERWESPSELFFLLLLDFINAMLHSCRAESNQKWHAKQVGRRSKLVTPETEPSRRSKSIYYLLNIEYN